MMKLIENLKARHRERSRTSEAAYWEAIEAVASQPDQAMAAKQVQRLEDAIAAAGRSFQDFEADVALLRERSALTESVDTIDAARQESKRCAVALGDASRAFQKRMLEVQSEWEEELTQLRQAQGMADARRKVIEQAAIRIRELDKKLVGRHRAEPVQPGNGPSEPAEAVHEEVQ